MGLTEFDIFSSFEVKALSVAAPTFENESLTCDVAKVCGTVTSHVRHFPLNHKITVTPSGLFPTVLQRPKGSLFANILAL